MSNILIIDSVTYKPYTFNTLQNEPLGGTEASVLRAITLLQSLGHTVNCINGAVELPVFIDINTPFNTPDIIIHLRTAKQVPVYYECFPHAKQYVWHHDLGGPWVKDDIEIYNKYNIGLIFVSEYHKTQFIDRGIRPFVPLGWEFKGSYHVINNLVDLPYVEVKRNYNKLLFASSPHKALNQTLKEFEIIKSNLPQMELFVCNPGYIKDNITNTLGVTYLGALKHGEVMAHMLDSLAVISSNHIIPETFGLVYTEANAMGTNVITHALGALPELLNNNQFVDTRKPGEVLKRVKILQSLFNYPTPKLFNNKDIVISQWNKVF